MVSFVFSLASLPTQKLHFTRPALEELILHEPGVDDLDKNDHHSLFNCNPDSRSNAQSASSVLNRKEKANECLHLLLICHAATYNSLSFVYHASPMEELQGDMSDQQSYLVFYTTLSVCSCSSDLL